MKLKNDEHGLGRQKPFDPSDLFLYAVTDTKMNLKWGHSITDAVKAAIEGGATIIQLRFRALKVHIVHGFLLIYVLALICLKFKSLHF